MLQDQDDLGDSANSQQMELAMQALGLHNQRAQENGNPNWLMAHQRQVSDDNKYHYFFFLLTLSNELTNKSL